MDWNIGTNARSVSNLTKSRVNNGSHNKSLIRLFLVIKNKVVQKQLFWTVSILRSRVLVILIILIKIFENLVYLQYEIHSYELLHKTEWNDLLIVYREMTTHSENGNILPFLVFSSSATTWNPKCVWPGFISSVAVAGPSLGDVWVLIARSLDACCVTHRKFDSLSIPVLNAIVNYWNILNPLQDNQIWMNKNHSTSWFF